MPRGGNFRRYSEEFKKTAIELALSGTQPVIQVARDLEMSEKTLYAWLRAHRQKEGLVEPAKPANEMEAELKRLRKENAQLKMERDILKKATAYFAKDAR